MKGQTYLFPRVHSSVTLLVEELLREKKSIQKNFETFAQVVLEE